MAQSTEEGVGARCLRLQRRGVGQGYSDYRVVEGQGGSDYRGVEGDKGEDDGTTDDGRGTGGRQGDSAYRGRGGGIKGLNLQRRGWGKVSQTTEKGRGARVLRLQSGGGTRGLRLDRGGEGDK